MIMLPYISAENGFMRAFGNRSLLMLFLCVLTRSGDPAGKASAFGISVDISQGLIINLGPALALMFMASLKMEADNLLMVRNASLAELRSKHMKINPCLYGLFFFPTVTVVFLIVQFYTNLVPA